MGPGGMARIQAAILRNAWEAVRPGGLLLYCTCSPLREEDEDVVRGFLSSIPDASLSDPPSGWPGPPDALDGGGVPAPLSPSARYGRLFRRAPEEAVIKWKHSGPPMGETGNAMDYYIAPSLLSADFGKLAEEIRAIEEAGADLLHVDVMDGRFVPNITIGPVVVKAIKKYASIPLDVHLMIVEPEKYIEAFSEAGADILTVHAEATPHLQRAVARHPGAGPERRACRSTRPRRCPPSNGSSRTSTWS